MIKILLLSIFAVSCAQVTSLNLTKHQFGVQPRKIIWLQIAGLKNEHLALLKYDYKTAQKKTSFEKFLCYGSAWEFNLYDLRPSENASFMSQLTGKKNIKSSCEDYEQKPIWSYLSGQGYKTALFSTPGAANGSVNSCSQSQNFYKELVQWKMDQKRDAGVKYFHLEKDDIYKKDQIYYDTACLTGKCFNSISKNIVATFERFQKNSPRFLYSIQDKSYFMALKNNNILKAKRVLSELDQAIRYFQNYTSMNKDTLLLVTGAKALDINFPKQGNQWNEYLSQGQSIKADESELISPVMALGARSENFCGVYGQSEILTRIFSGAKQQGLELEFINPFK